MAPLKAPANGVTVRMYRQGHGDCFLLALPRPDSEDTFYVLIDCGYKPGSQKTIHNKSIGDIVKNIGQATGKRIDLFIITHEHQDHVNGIWKKKNPYFGDFDIGEAWFAWTESPTDPLAEQLRERYGDQLLRLVKARQKLALAVGDTDSTVRRLDSLLRLEFGGEKEVFNLKEMRAAVADPSRSKNKQAMKLVKDRASMNGGVKYLQPGGAPLALKGTEIKAFVLGPPHDGDLLRDEDPVGKESFPGEAAGAHGLSFSAALGDEDCPAPFSKRFCLPRREALGRPFFREHYGRHRNPQTDQDAESASDAPWRRIGGDWLYASDVLALKMNTGINNTSLVLAFELPKSKKILLFVGDAQRGNWISWDDHVWQDGDEEVTARDILARTVLYKVGHHGSHNATLAGDEDSEYPNLSWMGKGAFGEEFTAMITAVEEWAMTKNNPPWRHPLPSIKKSLRRKAQGRVFQTDTDRPEKPENVPVEVWEEFLSRTEFNEIYFEYTILDE